MTDKQPWQPHTYWDHLDRAPFMWGIDVARDITGTFDDFEAGGGVILYPDEVLEGVDANLTPWSWPRS